MLYSDIIKTGFQLESGLDYILLDKKKSGSRLLPDFLLHSGA